MSSDMNDMPEMSNQSNMSIFADDWAPATLGNVNISTVTFTIGDEEIDSVEGITKAGTRRLERCSSTKILWLTTII